MAVVALFDADGNVLAVRRRCGRWELPGGKARDGELIQFTVAREVCEELGIWILGLQGDLDHVGTVPVDGWTLELFGTQWDGEQQPELREEQLEMAWVAPDRLSTLQPAMASMRPFQPLLCEYQLRLLPHLRPVEPPLSVADAHLHVGSSRPHAADGDAHRPASTGWAPSGSLRQLEPELHEVLLVECLPRTNIPRSTAPEEPPGAVVYPPGPFTTAQLIPAAVVEKVHAHGHAFLGCLERAGRGEHGWRHARQLRPEALILTEQEALNECGWGYVWRKRADADLWDVVQPSVWPSNKPNSGLDAERFEQLANATNLTDRRVVSWMKHGFPGARDMPRHVVLAFPHVGALKHPVEFEACFQRDIDEGFVSSGLDFPDHWPCVLDPMNVVMQNGKARLCIDKTMRHSSVDRPAGADTYNDCIDLEADRAQHGEFRLVRVWQFARASAILGTAGVSIVGCKFDLSAYFRKHGKQLFYVHQSARLNKSGWGFDFRVNFGERDAMDNTGDASNALTHFLRHELKRLDREYPSKAQRIIDWALMRMGLAAAAGEEADQDFFWSVYFFICYYVDDAGLTCFNDLVFDASGRPVTITICANDGTLSTRQQLRGEFYAEAAMGVVRSLMHETPEKKQHMSWLAPPLEYLGVDCLYDVFERRLSSRKRMSYSAAVQTVLDSVRLSNGALTSPRDDANSMYHKLIHASGEVPAMRAHLFHVRAALLAHNNLGWNGVIFGADAERELRWCLHQLGKSADEGIPFATRYEFPSSSDDTLVRYTDASREPDGDVSDSGFGGWAVVRGVFVYCAGHWTPHEVATYSINVLETKAKDMWGVTAIKYARAVGCTVTHSLAFTDNTTAECVAERGRTQAAALSELNVQRLDALRRLGVHEKTDRVASIDNDIADLLSRSRVTEALRIPRTLNMEVLELVIEADERDTSTLTATWA